MGPVGWQSPVDLSERETVIVQRVHRAKLFAFLRQERHVLFSEAFQAGLAALPMHSAEGPGLSHGGESRAASWRRNVPLT